MRAAQCRRSPQSIFPSESRERRKKKQTKTKPEALCVQLFVGLKSESRSQEQKERSTRAVPGTEGGWLLSVSQLARILSFSSGSLSLSPHLFLLQALLPLPFPARLQSQMKTREKQTKKDNKHTNKTRQKSSRLLAPWEHSAGAGSGRRGGNALRREGRESSRKRGPAGSWSLANCVPLACPALRRPRLPRDRQCPAVPSRSGDARRFCPAGAAVPGGPHSPAPAGGERARCRRRDSRPVGEGRSARAAPARSLRKRSATQRQ